MPSTEFPQSMFQKAKSGDANAIAQLIGHTSLLHGVTVQCSVHGSQLHLTFSGSRIPDQQVVVPLIQRGLMRFGFSEIRTVVLQAHPTADERPVKPGWTYQFQIPNSLNVELEKRPDTESLVRVHGDNSNRTHILNIGAFSLQPTDHGHLIKTNTRTASSLKRRKKTVKINPNSHHSLLDRQPETQDAISALTTKTSVEFYGGSGLGKSSLLHHIMQHPQIESCFKDGVSYHYVAFQPVEDILQDAFDQFYEWDSNQRTKPTNTELLKALQHLNSLAVLDDVSIEYDLLRQTQCMTVLSSSEKPQLIEVGQSIPMRGLPIPDAIALLERYLGRLFNDDSERLHAETICRVLKGHPLRIIQNIRFIREASRSGNSHNLPITLQNLAAQLESGVSSEALTIRGATLLPELERRVLAVLAIFEQVPTSEEHLKVLTGSSSLELPFQILLERGLIQREQNRYRIANNLVPYFQKIWDLTPWIERAIDYFKSWVQQHRHDWVALLNTHTTLWWITEYAVRQKRWETVLSICHALDTPLMLGKRWGRWSQFWNLGLTAARSIGDGSAEALAFHILGSRALCLGDFFTAHTYLTEAVQRRSALGDTIGSAVSQHNLNLVYQYSDSVGEIPHASENGNVLVHRKTLSEDGSQVHVSPTAAPSANSVNEKTPIEATQAVSGDAAPTVLQDQTLLSQSGSPSNAPSEAYSAASTNAASTQQTSQDGNSQQPLLAVFEPNNPNSSLASATASPNAVSAPRTSAPDAQYTPPPSTHLSTPVGKKPVSSAKTNSTHSPRGVAQATEVRSFPIGWIAGLAVAAVFGGLGAYFALNWDKTPMAFEPNSITFPPQLVGESSTRNLTITNTGSQTIELASIAFAEGDRLDFSIANEDCTQSLLEPDENCVVEVRFNPKESESRSTQLRIADSKGEYVRFVQVRGIGEVAQVTVTPDGLAFDPILAGSGQEPTQTITLRNESAVAFSMGEAFISGERTDAFTVAQDGCAGQLLDPNDTCSVSVGFTPPGGGVFEANFGIRDASGSSTWLNPLIGTGLLPAPSISPAGLAFGAEVIGRVSTGVVTITNTGPSPLQIESINITGDTENFALRGNTCTRNPIEPGQSCSATVGFSPQAERNYAGTLVISDNAVNSPRSITLTGQGTRVPAPVISPNPLMFGEQEVGSSAQESFNITNRGSQRIRVQSITMSQTSDFRIVGESCTNGFLSADGTCTVTIEFTPQGPGDRSSTITIRDTATGSPRTLNITGTGVAIPDPQILSVEVTPESIPEGERSRICYRVANVSRLILRDDLSGQRLDLEPDSGCATVTPSQTTRYTLIAEGRNGQAVSRQVRVEVYEPDTTPPPTPRPIAPGRNEYVLCPSTPTVQLIWNPVSDDGRSLSYTTILERGRPVPEPRDNSQAWRFVTEQSTSETDVDITQYLERGLVSYRWRVSAVDAAGNSSAPSNWLYFNTCE